MTTSPNSFFVLAAGEAHRPLLEQLWTMFRHDMSAFTGALPDNDGRFRQERLDAALIEPGGAALPVLARFGARWAGSSARARYQRTRYQRTDHQ